MLKLKRERALNIAIAVMAFIMIAYHFLGLWFLEQTSIGIQNTHYAFALVLVYLGLIRKRPRLTLLWILLLLVSLVATAYVHLLEDSLILRAGHPTGADMIMGTSLIVIAIVGAWFVWGPAIPVCSLVFIAYSLICEYLPPPLLGLSPSFPRLISMMSIGLVGLYGSLLSASASTMFYFMVFAGVFQASGATAFFEEIAKVVNRLSKAGPAQSSVVSSALFGMISGSAMANVAVDGVFTIPWMKKCGYRPEVAAAFEATASTGGQIMPPVMGIAAFAMAAMIGMPYSEVMVRAAIPAFFYFLCMAVQAELICRRDKLEAMAEPVDKRRLLLTAPLFIIPLAILTILLMQGHSFSFSVGFSVLGNIVVSMLRKETRPSFRRLLNGFVDGAMQGSQIAVNLAAITPMVVLTTYTGLAIKFMSLVSIVSFGSSALALLLGAVMAIILGAPLPTLAVYLVVALVVCPALVRMGIPLLAAHMFAFWYGVAGLLTPPVAPPALIASRIAGCGYIKAGLESSKLGIVVFIIPFLFAYNPVLLGYFKDPVSTVLALVFSIAVVLAFSFAMVGYLKGSINPIARVAWVAAAILMGGYVAMQNILFLMAGLGLAGLLLVSHLIRQEESEVKGQIAS